MFEREHHIRIATILQAIDSDLLVSHHCYFGGGTAIVLSHGEYRESVDLDFIVSDRVGYQTLRRLMREGGIQAIARSGTELNSVGEVRSDQYGIRTMLRVGETEIKLEIVLEGRIHLETPMPENRTCGIAMLAPIDAIATKLLANSDRWMDDSVFSRDLIDLAMLQPARSLLVRATEKATTAYGRSIVRDLGRAIERLGERKGRLDECMDALKMNQTPKALLWKRIRSLR